MDIGPGDEVITTSMTFCSTVNAIIHTGATPVIVDCERTTMNISAEAIEAQVTPRTKAIIVVHLCGRACDMDSIMAVARAHQIKVIEDCAHAIEATYKGTALGTIGDVGCFSFYVTKNLTTAEGGMVLTEDEALANRVKVLALHGMSKDAWKRFSDAGYLHYQVTEAGFKNNMTDLQASLGLSQLKRIDELAARRREIWNRYMRDFADLPCILPAPPEWNSIHAYHLFTPLLDLEKLVVSRDAVLAAMTRENIGVGVHYIPVHLHPFYQKRYGWGPGDLPNAEFIGTRTLSLPLSGGMPETDVDAVSRAFRKLLTYYRA
jgi:dTDP-4-amino-4,6-dideoxygalactose transaminase